MRTAVIRRSLVTVLIAGCLTILAVAVFSAGVPEGGYYTDGRVMKAFRDSEFGMAIGLLTDVTISGHLRNVNGRGLSGEPVGLSGDASRSTTTDSTGFYSFTVPSGGNYTVFPTDSRVSLWSPNNQIEFFPLTQSVSNADFQAQFPSFIVSGNVKNAAGNNLTGIKIRLTGTNITTKDYTTNSSGAYTSDQLNILGDYTFTPQSGTVGGLTYTSFNPANTVFTSIVTCSGANCSGFDYLGVNYVATVRTERDDRCRESNCGNNGDIKWDRESKRSRDQWMVRMGNQFRPCYQHLDNPAGNRLRHCQSINQPSSKFTRGWHHLLFSDSCIQRRRNRKRVYRFLHHYATVARSDNCFDESRQWCDHHR